MKTIFLSLFSFLFLLSAQAQTDSIQHFSKLEINKNKSKSFSGRDSTLILTIDTLVMNDRSKMIFYGKKNVTLLVKHAIIGKDALIYGTDGKNNGSDMDIRIRFDNLGSLTVSAAGLDAQNGTKTYPNGNGGKVNLGYLNSGIAPQQINKKEDAYLAIDTKAGGYSVNAQSDIRNILSRIGRGTRPLGQLPQGQVYSGSPGIDGKSEVKAISEF
jgi:hypothetical protein